MTSVQEAINLIMNSKESEISCEDLTKEDAIVLAEHLKITQLEQYLLLYGDIGDEGAIGIALHLKDAKVSQKIDISGNNIEDAGIIQMAAHLKDSQVSHTID